MITSTDYFAGYAGNSELRGNVFLGNAERLLAKVNSLLEWAAQNGWTPKINSATGTMVSGQRDGGWRPQECPIGASNSAHKQARAVDVADHDGSLDELLTDDVLEDFVLYREHPSATAGWCHLTDRAPGSGNRTFYP